MSGERASKRSASAGEFSERIGIFDEDIGVFSGGIGQFAPDGIDSGPDKMMAAFASVGLRRETADVMWEFFEMIEARKLASAKEGARLMAMFPAMLDEAMKAPLPRMQLRVLRMALGWADAGVESMRKCAEDYKYSQTQISNMVNAAQARYALPKNQFNKSEEAIAGYKQTNGKT